MSRKKILITGAAGFIGYKLYLHLKKKYEVFGLDFNILHNQNNELNEIDILNKDFFLTFLQKIKPDFVFHLAGYSGPARNEINRDLAYKYNVEVMHALTKCLPKSVPVFFSSTDKVYSGQIKPDEKMNLTKPKSYHGEVKLECEKILSNYTENFFIFRQSVVHGEGNFKRHTELAGGGSFIDFAIDRLNNKEVVKAYSNIKRCFLHVDQLIEVYSMLIESKFYGVYNIGSEATTYFDRIKNICDKKNILTKNFLHSTIGKEDPLVQDVNQKKFENTFKIKMN